MLACSGYLRGEEILLQNEYVVYITAVSGLLCSALLLSKSVEEPLESHHAKESSCPFFSSCIWHGSGICRSISKLQGDAVAFLVLRIDSFLFGARKRATHWRFGGRKFRNVFAHLLSRFPIKPSGTVGLQSFPQHVLV
jgi:hypothetical protein